LVNTQNIQGFKDGENLLALCYCIESGSFGGSSGSSTSILIPCLEEMAARSIGELISKDAPAILLLRWDSDDRKSMKHQFFA
jgi:hypothetical protein